MSSAAGSRLKTVDSDICQDGNPREPQHMPRAVVLLPSTTYRAADFVAAAESLNVDLVVASEQPPPFDMGDNYVQIDCSEPESAAAEITGLGDEVPLDAIVAADDAGVVVGAMAGSNLGLRANPPDAAATTRNKLEMRRRMATEEVPQPSFVALHANVDPIEACTTLGFPLVIKPVSRSASQGVIRADNRQELAEAVRRVRAIVGDEPLVVETYLPGAEVAVEGLLADGVLTVLAIFDKPDTSDGPYFPETIMVTPSQLAEEVQRECVRIGEAAVKALGLTDGPVHVELRADGDRVRVIEVAARSIGGLCSRSLNFGLMGTTLETLILRNALGMEKPELRREPSASGVLMIPIAEPGTFVALRGEAETRKIPWITGIDITTPPGSPLIPPPEGDRYLGFVFAKAPQPADVEASLREAQNTLKVVME